MPRRRVPESENASPTVKNGSTEPILPKSGEVIVRMYRQGLGDSFLLAFGTQEKPRYVLIDCGVHMRQPEGPARLSRVMRNIVAATNGRLHVVVASHEHADHLSGFVQRDSPFLKNELRIDHVWFAWTEQRGDPQADALRKKRGVALETVKKAVEALRERSSFASSILAEKCRETLSFVEPPEGSDLTTAKSLIDRRPRGVPHQDRPPSSPMSPGPSLNRSAPDVTPSSNELAIELLAAIGKEAKYCEPPETLRVPGVNDVRVYVLGPPRKETLLKKDLPSKVRGSPGEYKEVYLSGSRENRAFQLSPCLSGSAAPDYLEHPFAASYRRPYAINGGFSWKLPKDAALDPRTKAHIEETYLNDKLKWRQIDADWLGAAETLALNLDSDTNNTSLALAFELGDPGVGPVLLFPADAQVGNWLSWRRQEYGTNSKKLPIDDLLQRTVLYKVGHHGSHNATLRRDSLDTPADFPDGVPYGLELMRSIVAMIPVDRAAADRPMPKPWSMPHEPLYKRLREKAQGRVLRSDLRVDPLKAGSDPDLVPKSTTFEPVPGASFMQWRRSKQTFAADEGTPGPLYYDVLIDTKKL